jgi:hypothetical protein
VLVCPIGAFLPSLATVDRRYPVLDLKGIGPRGPRPPHAGSWPGWVASTRPGARAGEHEGRVDSGPGSVGSFSRRPVHFPSGLGHHAHHHLRLNGSDGVRGGLILGRSVEACWVRWSR